MRTIGDYYNTIQQAEKTANDLQELMKNYPSTGSIEYKVLAQAVSYIKKYIVAVKEKVVEP